MRDTRRILVIQTAFLGDVILTLPLVQAAARCFPKTEIDVLVVPTVRNVLENHPAISRVISYDKRGVDRGLPGLIRVASQLRRGHYDLTLVPHRSLRSAVLSYLTGAPRRIAFDRSAGRMLFTDTVPYDHAQHEIERNLSLLRPLKCSAELGEPPRLYPSEQDRKHVDERIRTFIGLRDAPLVAIAPGTVWETKQWLPDRFAQVGSRLIEEGCAVVFIGGPADASICAHLAGLIGSPRAISVAGELTLLQSAEVLRHCRVLVCNDSAPLHMAVGVQTTTVAIFGATVPEFGFAPYGPGNVVVQKAGLSCRPCSIHGGHTCPIQTFDCMKLIEVEDVFREVIKVLRGQEIVTD